MKRLIKIYFKFRCKEKDDFKEYLKEIGEYIKSFIKSFVWRAILVYQVLKICRFSSDRLKHSAFYVVRI